MSKKIQELEKYEKHSASVTIILADLINKLNEVIRHLNEQEGEAADKVWPKIGSEYWLADPAEVDMCGYYGWYNTTENKPLKDRNLIYRTKEEAQAAARKMLDAVGGVA